jgi:uncharacterized protein (TIGR03083 family)
MLDADSIDRVLDVLRPERRALLDLLEGIDDDQWHRATECPRYTVKGIATHILGDDLSILSRQRDAAEPGLIEVAVENPGVDFRTLLDTFNDRWVTAAQFFSVEIVMELLDVAGEWTAAYYERVDPDAPGERVGFFGATGENSPFWQAIAREYFERWIHHSQIRRAVGLTSLAARPFVDVGVDVAAAVLNLEPSSPTQPDQHWLIGSLDLGSDQQAADILTRAYTADEISVVVVGSADEVESLAMFAAR